MSERTLAIIKPDAVKKNAIGDIINRYEKAGLKPVAIRLMHLSKSGLKTSTPSGATEWLPWMAVTSRELRCSIGMSSPEAVLRSMVEYGAAT